MTAGSESVASYVEKAPGNLSKCSNYLNPTFTPSGTVSGRTPGSSLPTPFGTF